MSIDDDQRQDEVEAEAGADTAAAVVLRDFLVVAYLSLVVCERHVNLLLVLAGWHPRRPGFRACR